LSLPLLLSWPACSCPALASFKKKKGPPDFLYLQRPADFPLAMKMYVGTITTANNIHRENAGSGGGQVPLYPCKPCRTIDWRIYATSLFWPRKPEH